MVLMVVSMATYAFLPIDNFWLKFAARIALLPLIIGASYELIRFAARRQGFELPLAPQGTAFQQAAWQALAAIPYGETRSYAQQAAVIGRPTATRAIGAANGRNPLPIVVPCHRVIAAGGGEEEDLGFCRPPLGIPRQKKLADFLGAGAAAGLAGEDDFLAVTAQPFGQKPRLGGLARPVDPFKSDETALSHPWRSMFPQQKGKSCAKGQSPRS